MTAAPGKTRPEVALHEKSEELVRQVESWLRDQRAADLLTAAEAETLLAEIRTDDAYWQALRPRFDEIWARLEAQLREEERPLDAILADGTVRRAVEAAGDFEPDMDMVGAFLRSRAVEAMLGDLLYTGINEFIRRVDILGAVIDKLPVIGGIRKKILATLADEMERRLEGQIKGFLGGFSGMAVERMIAFIFRPENRPGFRTAQRRLIEHVLARPLNTLLPGAEQMRWLRDATWSSLREPALKDERQAIELAFELVGHRPLADWLWPLSKNAHLVEARAVSGFWESEQGSSFEP